MWGRLSTCRRVLTRRFVLAAEATDGKNRSTLVTISLVFSSRLHWAHTQNPLSALLDEKRAAGVAILDLTESNPTRAGLKYPEADILDALSGPAALRYEPDPRGLLSAREAVSKYYAERGLSIPTSRIILTASTSEAYAYLFKLLADPGDEVLAPRPSYPLFEFLAGLESVRVRQYPLRYDGAWHIDFDALERSVSPRTRGVIVVNPNNPTGSFLKRGEADQLEDFAARHELAVLSDEVFADYGFGAGENRVTTLAGRAAALTFCMSGLSKIAGLPQMKLGWIVVRAQVARMPSNAWSGSPTPIFPYRRPCKSHCRGCSKFQKPSRSNP